MSTATIDDSTTIQEVASAAATWERNVKDLASAKAELKIAEEGFNKKKLAVEQKLKAVEDSALRVKRLAKNL